MQGRRITALLLTAFLVAQLLWRWQFGAIAPVSTIGGGWTEVASGAYVAYGDLLLPSVQGPVLRRTSQGWVQARPSWTARLSGVQVAFFGEGSAEIAVARFAGGVRALPRYGPGYLVRDPQQNLWLVRRKSVQLLLGGGRGDQSREAFFERAASMRRQGSVPGGWQAVWAADPLPVGAAIWYLSNRDGQAGITPPHVFRLQGTQDGPVPALTALGSLRLLSAADGSVLAADATGAVLRIDARSGSVTERRTDLLVLAAGTEGRLLLLRAAPSGQSRLEVTQDALKSLEPVRLVKGVRALGSAAFSMHGNWLALLSGGPQGTFVSVVRLEGPGAPAGAQLIAPPAGTQIDTAMPLSICDGVLYLTTRQGSREQTWSRPLGGSSPLALRGLGHRVRKGSGHG